MEPLTKAPSNLQLRCSPIARPKTRSPQERPSAHRASPAGQAAQWRGQSGELAAQAARCDRPAANLIPHGQLVFAHEHGKKGPPGQKEDARTTGAWLAA